MTLMLKTVESALIELVQQVTRLQDEIARLRGLLCSCKNAMIVANGDTDWTAMIDHIATVLTPNDKAEYKKKFYF